MPMVMFARAKYLIYTRLYPDRCSEVMDSDRLQVLHFSFESAHGLKTMLALKKIFIGQISKGFDFLGYRFGTMGLTDLAQQTIDNHKQRLLLLYEQNASDQRVEINLLRN